ncbi:MAG: cysteine--tRNA ligase [Verrucomicrobia bacterium]|nr:cysteine--tRNA ligase [Verrucomicrobiota bacterium]MBS0645073.1 cysteine--tRNA ligase [Verrucomicrobiota bacterium]
MLTHTIEFPDLTQVKLRLFNTETRCKEDFKPHKKGKVSLYTCGPTVYNFAHIGNFRTYVFEDILRRTLKFLGYQVTQVMNITDVDDKTIRGAIEAKTSLLEYVEPYKEAFFADLQTLCIEPVEHYPCATHYIPQMIDFIQKLLDKKIAYSSHDKSIYFSISQCPSYGRLSHLELTELKSGAGGTTQDEYEKEYVGDFVLWKAYDPTRDGNIYWDSPFGPGRPGWHLECSTMAMHLLGESLDVHVGAVDNIFPHHENEIAQSECCSGKKFVRYWLHSEHLIVGGKKMSKSMGNFYTLRDLLAKGYQGPEVRYMLLQTHYRTQLNFTFEGMEASRHTLERLNAFVLRMQESSQEQQGASGSCRDVLKKTVKAFVEAMVDDLSISVALAALFDLMREVNILCDHHKVLAGDAQEVLEVLQRFNQILGVLNFEQHHSIPVYFQQLLEQRETARKEKNWTKADQLRHEIQLGGYVIEDTAHGVRLKKKT